jgi:hypothetical protein
MIPYLETQTYLIWMGPKNSKIKQSTLLDTSIFKMQDDNRAMFGSASLNKNVSRIRERERDSAYPHKAVKVLFKRR